MNFKKYHVSRNLFDETTLENGIYLAANGNKDGDATNGVRAGVKIKVLPNTAYTFSAQSSANVSLRILEWSNGTFTTQTPKYNISGNISLTVTTDAETTEIAFNIEGANGQYVTNIMLNEGSTPLPYEPYSSEVWHDIPHYIHSTSTDTITTLPAVLYPTGTTATVGLKGNTLQSSIPSPTSPVMPQGTGERTGNLFDDFDIVGQVPSVTNGELVNSISGGTTSFIPLSNPLVSLTQFSSTMQTYLFLYDENKTFIGQAALTSVETVSSSVITGYANAKYARIRSDKISLYDKNVTLVYGSTAPSEYIPYGYKIPISSNSVTTPVYLGEVESTRRIFKLVLIGQENWKLQSINSYGIANLWITLPKNYVNQQSGLSSHFTLQTTMIADTKTDGFYLTSGDVLYIRINATSASTANELKSYLAAQYAAGTPVTVWYVLAEPTTGIVNEPLMKMGDYADEVSGISIPTIAGANTITVDTTLQPSEVSVNYKGWHPVQSVHERESGQWD